ELLTTALPSGAVGEYQLQAAIAAVHDEAPTAADTDWPQILALYGLLEHMTANPIITLNRAVAVAMVEGPAAGLAALEALEERLALGAGALAIARKRRAHGFGARVEVAVDVRRVPPSLASRRTAASERVGDGPEALPSRATSPEEGSGRDYRHLL